MFVVLRIITPEKSLSKRRRQRKIIGRSSIRTCQTEMGLPFFVLDVLSEKRGINWDAVAEKCGRYTSRIIAPRNCPLPDSARLRRYIPQVMNSSLIFSTAEETIKKADVSPENLCITVTDRNAVQYQRICSLLPYASCVRVITSHPERYAKACIQAYEDFGASLIIRSRFEPSAKSDIVICCDGAVTSAMDNAVIFTSSRKNGGKLRFSGSGTVLTDEHQRLIGDSVDPVDFVGAITELCGSPKYRNSVFEHIDISCSECDNSAPEECLRCGVSDKFPLLINT